MVSRALLNHILADDRLTQGLHDPEARILVEWLVACAERWSEHGLADNRLRDAVEHLCRRARSIGVFVRLWCYQNARGSAYQLAATERFSWPLPVDPIDPCDLMAGILAWEEGCSAA